MSCVTGYRRTAAEVSHTYFGIGIVRRRPCARVQKARKTYSCHEVTVRGHQRSRGGEVNPPSHNEGLTCAVPSWLNYGARARIHRHNGEGRDRVSDTGITPYPFSRNCLSRRVSAQAQRRVPEGGVRTLTSIYPTCPADATWGSTFKRRLSRGGMKRKGRRPSDSPDGEPKFTASLGDNRFQWKCRLPLCSGACAQRVHGSKTATARRWGGQHEGPHLCGRERPRGWENARADAECAGSE